MWLASLCHACHLGTKEGAPLGVSQLREEIPNTISKWKKRDEMDTKESHNKDLLWTVRKKSAKIGNQSEGSS